MHKKSDQLIQRLFKQLSRQEIKSLASLIICSAGVSAGDFMFVVLLADLVSTLASGGGIPIRNLVLAVIAAGWVTSLARFGVKLWQSRLIYGIWESLNSTLLTNLLYQPYNFYLNNDRNEINAKLQLQLSQLRDNIVKPLIEAASSAVTAVMLASGLLWLTGKGSLLVLLIVLFGYTIQVLQLKPILQRNKRKTIQAETETNNLIIDSFANIRRLLLERGQRAVLSQKNRLDQQIARNASWAYVLPHLPRQLVEPLGLTAVLLFLQIPSIRSNGSDALPWLALVTMGLLRLSQPMQKLSESYNRLQSGIPLLDNLLPLLELPIDPPVNDHLPQLLWQELCLEEISYKYTKNTRWTLKELNLTLKRGEIVAIAGASGSGKSTLSSILVGLLNPDKGKIFIDKKLLFPKQKEEWQNQCSEVSQSPNLLKGSVRMNLGGWSQPAPDTALIQALEQVGLKQRVEELPHGLDSWVGDQGQGWSGGEQQRLALAAALLRKPGLIVLDEATSGVHEALAENLIGSLRSQAQQPTVVIITHRESVMRSCDRVVVIKEGAIVADGAFTVLKQGCSELKALLAQASEPLDHD